MDRSLRNLSWVRIRIDASTSDVTLGGLWLCRENGKAECVWALSLLLSTDSFFCRTMYQLRTDTLIRMYTRTNNRSSFFDYKAKKNLTEEEKKKKMQGRDTGIAQDKIREEGKKITEKRAHYRLDHRA